MGATLNLDGDTTGKTGRSAAGEASGEVMPEQLSPRGGAWVCASGGRQEGVWDAQGGGTQRGTRQWGGHSGALKTHSTQGEKFTLEATRKS